MYQMSNYCDEESSLYKEMLQNIRKIHTNGDYFEKMALLL